MTIQKKIAAFAMAFVVIIFFAPRVYANSAEPPSFVIYSLNAPKDAEIFILAEDGEHNASMYDKRICLWETSFFIDYYGFDKTDNKLMVRSAEKSFEVEFPDKYVDDSFSSFYTLDFEAETLTENISPLRAPLYMLLRVMFTLIIECGFYFLVGYREKRSYIMFITVNLITQMFVNLVINGGSLDIFYSYTLLIYIGMELLVFIAEMIALPITVKEKKAGWTVLWTFAANNISMVIGGIALLFVPF